MKKVNVILAAMAIVVAMGGVAMAADNSANATADTQAVVVKPITLQMATHLNFGRLASAETATISIAAVDGQRTSTANGVDLVAAKGAANAPSRATFTVGGETGLGYSITGGTGSIELSDGAAHTILATLTGVYVPSKAGGAGIAEAGTLPEGGETLGVGASIPITAATVSGTYSNSGGISLTVAYN